MLLWNTQRQLCSILKVGLIIYWLYFAMVTWIYKLWERKYLVWRCRKLRRVIVNIDELDWRRVLYQDTGSCFGKPSAKKKKTQNLLKNFSKNWPLLLMEAEYSYSGGTVQFTRIFISLTWSTFTITLLEKSFKNKPVFATHYKKQLN